MNEGTSFRQFDYCKICRINHKKRKKHIYSKLHQKILQNILRKFTTKIAGAKRMLFSPEVRDVEFEEGAKFWCYFCAEEIEKHQRVEMTTVMAAGLLEHIASTGHHENTVQFFWDNLITDKKLKSSFLLTLGDLDIFKKASFLAVKKYLKAKEADRKKVAATITYSEFQRQNIHQSECTKSQIEASKVDNLPGTSRQPEERIIGKKTVSVYAEGLACVNIKRDESEGNIFTGATPPWLLKEEPTGTAGCIGPTMEDYQKHLEREKKSKLPASRVGAKFDHSAESAQDWLPSFGRVWNKGRRLQSKLHFEKEWKAKASASTPGTKKSSSNDIVRNTNNNQDSYPSVERTINLAEKLNQGLNGDTGPISNTSFQSGSHGKRSFQNETESISPSSVDVHNHIMPYKRKSRTESRTANESHWTGVDNFSTNQNDSYKATNERIPYKRRRHEDTVSGALIQTPILAFENFKPI